MKHPWKSLLTTILALIMSIAIGCGGSPATKTGTSNPPSAQNLVDPSGNWKMSFVDSNGGSFILSTLFNQTGAVVTGVNISEVGNSAPPFTCTVQADATVTNGLVQNVNQFSGNFNGNFGVITFNSALNDAGTHASGTYTVTPGAEGQCVGINLTGSFTADEIPSMSGNWTGTISCSANCPAGTPLGTAGTVTMVLTQSDSTGAVNGTYNITGLPKLSTGTVISNLTNLQDGIDLLSGASWQDSLADQNGIAFKIVGGPLNSFGTAGLGTDGSFNGDILGGVGADGQSETKYAVSMHH